MHCVWSAGAWGPDIALFVGTRPIGLMISFCLVLVGS